MKNTWKVVPNCPDGIVRVFPEDDAKPHKFGMDCECCPWNPDGDEGIETHNAFDGRHLIESGQRKVS